MLEEKKERNTKKVWLLILVMVILLSIAALGGYFIGKSKINNKEQNQNEKETEDREEIKELKLTEESKKKMERFINSASYDDSITSSLSTAQYFNAGTSSITKEIKLKMAYNDVLIFGQSEKDYELTQEEVNQMDSILKEKGQLQSGEIVTVIKTADFEKAYKDFFNENPDYNLSDIKDLGCPLPWGIDKNLGKIYLFSRCGGSGGKYYRNEIISYEVEKDNFIVKQKVELYDAYGDKVENSFNLIWKFDSTINFVSTTKE